MAKLDLTRQYKAYYTANTEPTILVVEKAQFLSITGKGDPDGGPFTQRIQALYSVAYKLKFMYKEQGRDFGVAKLEGLWGFDTSRHGSPTGGHVSVPRNEWMYRLMIRMPDLVTKEEVAEAITLAGQSNRLARGVRQKATSGARKATSLAHEVGLFIMEEGKAVQVLHTGPFATEPATLEKIWAFMRTHGLTGNGLHHEIYLSDFRRTAPEKLRTILREPVR